MMTVALFLGGGGRIAQLAGHQRRSCNRKNSHRCATSYTLDYTTSPARRAGANISLRYGWPDLC